MIKKISVFLLLSMILISQNVFAALPTTSTNNQAQIISKNVLYKDNFENIYKIGYEVKIKNISKNTWLSESSEQVILKSKNDKTNQFPIFLPYDIKPNEYIEDLKLYPAEFYALKQILISIKKIDQNLISYFLKLH